ncbi:MAG: protein kinase [Gaiellaceae bacterium]
MVGELIAARYELEELVGTGGMSSVYRARDQLLERPVALKLLHQQLMDDGDHVERFRREARAVAQLSHPNIVTVIDRGEQDGRQFIVFEFVEGENLKALVERDAPLPEREAIELTLQVARALAFAHDHGLVHRDVKPQNVLLDADGRAKVTDFGIAHSIDVQGGLTQTGTVMGTSDYIAPEQARGSKADAQTDEYSLGVVLYELLTGEVPFSGDNFVAVAMRHINEPVPSVRRLRPDVSPRVDAAIRRAMAKDPRDRFQSMDGFAAELEACLGHVGGRGARPGDETVVVSPPSRGRRRGSRGTPAERPTVWPLILLLAGLVVLAGIFAAVFALTGSTPKLPSIGGKGGGGSQPVHLAGITAYDPHGDNHVEHNDAAKLATDGNPATYWTTEQYNGGRLGKDGVGLVLDASRSRKLSKITVTTDTPGFTAQIQAGPSPAGSFTPVSGSKIVTGPTTFSIHGAGARYYLVWITNLGSNRAVPNSAVHVTEVTARSG